MATLKNTIGSKHAPSATLHDMMNVKARSVAGRSAKNNKVLRGVASAAKIGRGSGEQAKKAGSVGAPQATSFKVCIHIPIITIIQKAFSSEM